MPNKYYHINKKQKLYHQLVEETSTDDIELVESVSVPGTSKETVSELVIGTETADMSGEEHETLTENNIGLSQDVETREECINYVSDSNINSDNNFDCEIDTESDGFGYTSSDSEKQIHLSESNEGTESAKTSSPNFKDSLKSWALTHNITHSAINDLLRLLKPSNDGLPLDARTLLGTSSSSIIEKFDSGEFCYFGVEYCLKNFLETTKLDIFQLIHSNCLHLNFNIDGIPLFRSSSISFWPILCSIHDIDMMPLVVAVYCGAKKPEINSYLLKFTNEMKCLRSILFNGLEYSIIIRAFICDAPAKSFIKQVKQHGGYFACDKCHTKGKYNDKARSISYDKCVKEARSDEEFRSKSSVGHHIGDSPLLSLPVNMITVFCLDYMHLVLLGVCRKLLHFWMSVIPFKLSSSSKTQITECLILCKKYLPVEFNRKPDNFSNCERWKASECRTFLLYVGLLCLKNHLTKKQWNHFFTLSVAIRILCSNTLSQDLDLVNYAEKLLTSFVKDYDSIYPNASIVYNTHCLLHLPDEVRRLGSLDSFSAFHFENFLGIMKKRIRTGTKPLSQIARRLSEVGSFTFSEKSNKKYSRVTVINKLNFIIGELKNSCVLLDDDTVGYIVGQKNDIIQLKIFIDQSPLFTKPISTAFIYLYQTGFSTKNISMKAENIVSKCFVCPFLDGYAVIPLL